MAAEYQHLWDHTKPGQYSSTVLRYIDSAYIPGDPANSDRQRYTQYVADGGVTDPPPPLTLPDPEPLQLPLAMPVDPLHAVPLQYLETTLQPLLDRLEALEARNP